VTGTNGDSWSETYSGSSGKTSSPIKSQTAYTLSCQAFSGGSPPSFSETQTINVLPQFQER
jgi:hypothetical protein